MKNSISEPVASLSENEMAWISFLRELTENNVPGPTLVAVQALRFGLLGRKVCICPP